VSSDPNGGSFPRSDDWMLCCFQLIWPPAPASVHDEAKPVARLPWAHRTPLQQLLLFLLTANVSNKSGNLLFAQSYPEQYENVGFVHSWCTVEFHQKSDRVNPSLRLRGDERELRRISDAIVILDPSGATCTESANGCGHIMISGRRSEVPKNNWPN
jgi:hypothetical protein